MRVCYTAYSLSEETPDGENRYLININKIIDCFLSEKKEFRRKFMINGEHIYIFSDDFPRQKNTFLLVVTKNNEIIKAIDASTVTVQDITTKLSENEELGFASFFYTGKPHCIAFVNRMLSPRITLLGDLINQYFEKKFSSSRKYKLILTPLINRVGKNELLSMDFIGKTTMEASSRGSLGKALMEFIGGNATDDNISSIEVTIKPLRNKSIKKTVTNVATHIDTETVKFVAQAKQELQPILSDLYVIGQGKVSDKLKNIPTLSIPAVDKVITERLYKNKILEKKLSEFETDAFEKTPPTQFNKMFQKKLKVKRNGK